jgi:molybdate transport system permease protein
MDWDALRISVSLAAATALLLALPGILLARWLAYSRRPWRPLVEAGLTIPLILPPTVLGFYLLSVLGSSAPLGVLYQHLFGTPLAFSFSGLLLASVVFNLPFTVMPMQRAFAAIAPELLDAARTCGLSRWRTLWRIELPLAWPGLLTALIMTAAHTLGEFGVVLMVGGNIPGETRTIAISIYDRVQAFELESAANMSALLLVISLVALMVVSYVGGGRRSERGLL